MPRTRFTMDWKRSIAPKTNSLAMLAETPGPRSSPTPLFSSWKRVRTFPPRPNPLTRSSALGKLPLLRGFTRTPLQAAVQFAQKHPTPCHSSRDAAALRNDNSLGVFKLHHFRPQL